MKTTTQSQMEHAAASLCKNGAVSRRRWRFCCAKISISTQARWIAAAGLEAAATTATTTAPSVSGFCTAAYQATDNAIPPPISPDRRRSPLKRQEEAEIREAALMALFIPARQ